MTDSDFAVMCDKLMSIGAESAVGESVMLLAEMADESAARLLAKHRRRVYDRAMAMCKAAFIVEKARGEKDE